MIYFPKKFAIMKTNFFYVVYLLQFTNGQYYIGKAKNFKRRMQEHHRGKFDGINLKERTVLTNIGFTCRILKSAPPDLSDNMKQIWIDNMERTIIHCESKKVYDEITGEDSHHKDYQPYKHIVNRKLVNTQLY